MDRNLGAFKRLVQRFVGNEIVGPRVDYLASYPATAVTQNGDGTLEIQPDDSRLPPLSSVPIRYGVPGVSARIANGGRVLLAFAGGDPAKPIATVWEAASVVSLTVAASAIHLGAGAAEALVKGTSYASHMAQLATALTALSAAMVPALPPASAVAAATAATSAATAATALAADISAQNTTI